MPKKPEKKSHLTIVREALGLSQSQFAERLGVSASIIKKVEEGKRQGSEDLKGRIYAETGLPFFNQDEAGHIQNENFTYTKAQHEAWLQEAQFNQQSAEAAAGAILKLVQLLLIAGARPGVRKSYQVFNALLLAVERVKNEFHMEKHLEAEMRDRQMTESGRFTIRELRANPHLAKLWNFFDDSKRKDDEIVVLERTTGWIPSKTTSYILSQHRELVIDILRTQAGTLSDEAKAKLEALNQKIEKEIEEEWAKFIPAGSLIKTPPRPSS